ncbi:MAG: apolipoprotein N-acyltransferase [Gammaproteobacteria bacterium]|nr:apolipoprotein N-acyltransferase [Gammaproteobacteria bacterium]
MKNALAFLAGAAAPAAFAPLNWWPVGLLSLAVLFSLWLTAGRAAAARYGFLYGLGLFGVGASWTYISIHTFGGMPAALAGLCILLLVAALALFPAAAGFAQGIIGGRTDGDGGGGRPGAVRAVARAALVMPGAWLAAEWLRGWLFTGFPWLTAGYAFLDTPLAGWAPLGGVYAVSLAALVTAGALTVLATGRGWRGAAAAALAAVLWFGGGQLGGVEWTRRDGAPVKVAIIQNNVPLAAKWDAARAARIIGDYLDASDRHRDADLVLWPEAAAPDYLDRLPADFHRRLREHPADFIFGVLTRRRADGGWQYFNSIATATAETTATTGDRDDSTAGDQGRDSTATVTPDIDAPAALYHKQHLVPFGEFLPVEWLFGPVVRQLDIPMANFTAWPQGQPPLRAAGVRLAASLCYEDAFPAEWRAQVPAAGLLVNLSEDVWFGDSLAPHQRLQMARFRALESGRPLLRASNNGLSSVIDERGGIVAIAPQFTVAAVAAAVAPRAGITPYIARGDWPALALGAALLALGGLAARPPAG